MALIVRPQWSPAIDSQDGWRSKALVRGWSVSLDLASALHQFPISVLDFCAELCDRIPPRRKLRRTVERAWSAAESLGKLKRRTTAPKALNQKNDILSLSVGLDSSTQFHGSLETINNPKVVRVNFRKCTCMAEQLTAKQVVHGTLVNSLSLFCALKKMLHFMLMAFHNSEYQHPSVVDCFQPFPHLFSKKSS